MNIQQISNFRFITNKNYNNQNGYPKVMSNYGIKMSAPLRKDTVSFGIYTPKGMGKTYNGITLSTAKEIYGERVEIQKKINAICDYIFGNLVITEEKPDNLIEKISGRVKRAESVVEKSCTRGWGTKEDVIANMTDLNGKKISVYNANKKNIATILGCLLDAIKKDNVILVELENKIPVTTKNMGTKEAEKYSYASKSILEKLCKISEQKNRPVNIDLNDYTLSNYSALHMLLKVPVRNPKTQKLEWPIFELQIMGHDVAVYKELDDIIYKIINGKNVDAKYNQIQKILNPIVMPNSLLQKTDKEIRNLSCEDLLEMGCSEELAKTLPDDIIKRVKQRRDFDAYRKEVFLRQRKKEPIPLEFRNDDRMDFFPLLNSKRLSRQFDANYLYKLMKQANDKI